MVWSGERLTTFLVFNWRFGVLTAFAALGCFAVGSEDGGAGRRIDAFGEKDASFGGVLRVARLR